MANKFCSACGKEIAGHATHCAYCRAEQPAETMTAKWSGIGVPAHQEQSKVDLPPGWYERPGEHNSLSYWDGVDFTDYAPARIKVDVMSVAWGVVVGWLIAGGISAVVWLVIYIAAFKGS